MSYTLVLLLHSFGSACRSNRRRPTIHFFVRSHVSSDADFKRSPLLAGGCGAGQVLLGTSVEGHLSEYATIPRLGLPVSLQRCPTIDGGRPLISDSTMTVWPFRFLRILRRTTIGLVTILLLSETHETPQIPTTNAPKIFIRCHLIMMH